MKINVLSAIVLLLVVSSCSTSKTAYFENLDIEEMSGKMDVGNYELRIAPDDMLSITFRRLFPMQPLLIIYRLFPILSRGSKS